MSSPYRITPTPTLLRVDFVGAIDEPDVAALARDLQRMVKVLTPGGFNVLFNCVELPRYTLPARDALVAVQQSVAKVAKRTAYLADRPNIRGMALWVAHLSEDQNVKVVVTQAQAEEWWNATEGRVEQAKRGLR